MHLAVHVCTNSTRPAPQVARFEGSTKSDEFQQQSEEVHAQFVSGLRQLWEGHKELYAKGRRRSLELVE